MGEQGARRQLDERARTRVAERLIARHGDAVFASARRYTLSREDAEDAYQRALEILLTKAPAVPEDELVPWLRTVVKHEAFAIWRSRDRAIATTSDDGLDRTASVDPSPVEQVENYERLQVGAEAMQRLKPQETRALLLRAEGLSYKQICERTGWTYTKGNRCWYWPRRFGFRSAGLVDPSGRRVDYAASPASGWPLSPDSSSTSGGSCTGTVPERSPRV